MTKTVPKKSVFVLARWKFAKDVLTIPFFAYYSDIFRKGTKIPYQNMENYTLTVEFIPCV